MLLLIEAFAAWRGIVLASATHSTSAFSFDTSFLLCLHWIST